MSLNMKFGRIAAAALICTVAMASFDADARLSGESLVLKLKKAVVALFTPSTITPNASAYFGQDNAQSSGVVNNALKTNGGSAGAFYVPSTVTNSWFVYVEGVTNDVSAWSSAVVETALSNCTSVACTGGNDRVLQFTSPSNNVALAFALSGSISGNKFWEA